MIEYYSIIMCTSMIIDIYTPRTDQILDVRITEYTGCRLLLLISTIFTMDENRTLETFTFIF